MWKCKIGLHDYRTIHRLRCKALMGTGLCSSPIKVPSTTIIKRCTLCGKEIAILTNGLTSNKVDREYVRVHSGI